MSWRAFIIGLLAVILIAALTPFNDFLHGNTYITGNHFPPGPFFLLLVLTLGVNVLFKLVRRSWALKRSELMLVWCMMIAASTVPASGLMRFLFSLQAAPAYYATAPDLPDQSRVLAAVPQSLVLSKDPRSVPARRFFEGRRSGEEAQTYWRLWLRPLSSWLIFVAFFYLAIFFIGGLLCKQWVDVERLIFPLARVPLELTEGSGEPRLVPSLLRNRAFLAGGVLTLLFALWRAAPALMGQPQGWLPQFPIQQLLANTPLGQSSFGSAYIFPLAIGIAFLVPADVALSVWLFFIFTRMELQVSAWIGVPIQGGTYGDFMKWQQAGAFITFTVMMLWAARRHLAAVFRKAVGLGRDIDDSEEPISFRVSFWGLLLALGGMMGWFVYYGMNVFTASALLALMLCVALVHARLVAQGGIFFTQQTWSPPVFLHSITGGHAFGASAAVVAQMQNAILIQDSREILSGHAMNALRISSVFDKHRRWFLPALLAALAVAVAVGIWSSLEMYYSVGGYNIPNTYGTISLPKTTFRVAGQMIASPARSAQPHFGPLAAGAGIMFFLTVMRTSFYWWPVHSLGFLIASTWPAHNLWFSFLIAWSLKVFIMKFGGGSMLRTGRNFFLGVIIGEAFAIAISTLLGLLAGIKIGFIFLPG